MKEQIRKSNKIDRKKMEEKIKLITLENKG